MREVVEQLHLLDEVRKGLRTDQVIEVVVLKSLRQPEGNGLVVGRIVLEGHEGLEVTDLAVSELRHEPLVLAPEQPNVRDLEQRHGNPLQANAKGPASVGPTLVCASTPQYLVLHDSTAQHLQPLPLPPDLQLPRRVSKREVRVDPPHLFGLEVAEQAPDQPLQTGLQVRLHLCCIYSRHHLDALHLVEDPIVCPVDLVAAVHVPADQELAMPLSKQVMLMGAGVRAQDHVAVQVVRVVGRAGLVPLRDQK
mmetsp:Transcript_137807/g.239702  ORF Transcript_137807/g.239702 Transcript_137807/m.239702 type:complete len:251 (+) Transcript_137807:577-1329(+)